ncbi:MAG: CapA family protein [Bacteroidales bacterium]|nr:CapA family protein [Bacteroidales bacterium]
MKRIKLMALGVLFTHLGVFAQPADTSYLSLLFVGDIMGHGTQIVSAYDDSAKVYDYSECFRYIKPVISAVDLAFANLEVTLAGKPYKGYPQFSSPDELAVAIKDAGFDVLVNANNHACDRRKKGVVRTINVLDSLQITHTGTFVNATQRNATYPLIVEKNNIRLAILNYTYGTNGIPVPKTTIVNLLDSTVIRKDLTKAKLLNPDKIIVIVHWGTEYQNLPNANQKKWYSFLKNYGADIVIGSHPHVIQPMNWEKDSDRFVVYSMGNFISNQRAMPKDGGLLVKLNLEKVDDNTRLADASYLFSWVYRPKIDDKYHFMIVPAAEYETMPPFFQADTTAYPKMMRFLDFERKLLKEVNVKEN